MKTNIFDLVAQNPSGLMQLKNPLTVSEYRDNFGFGLKNIWTIFESKKSHHSFQDWFAFSGKTLETLFSVQQESKGGLLVVYVVETIKGNNIHCNLILTDEAWKSILADKSQHVLKVHQMYTKFFEDHIALNMAN